MNIIVNGEPHEVVDGLTVQQLLQDLQLLGKRVAVEINREIAPRSTLADHHLAEDDRVEVVHAIGGG